LGIKIQGDVRLNKEELFNYYFNLQSEEFKEEIEGYKDFRMDNVVCSIKVNFKNGSWIRVYEKLNGAVEWY
jgi:hypothetical protein